MKNRSIHLNGPGGNNAGRENNRFVSERIDITDWPISDIEKLDLQNIERIERGDGKVIAVIISRKQLGD